MDLLEFLGENKNARKIFGSRELKIIEKQLMGIKLTQSEKNRLSRDIREKLRFVEGVSEFKDEFNLKKGKIIKEIIEDTKEEILKSKYFPQIQKIILFGSTVDNQRTFRSDIDIAVQFNKITKSESIRFRLDILKRINEKVDMKVYNVLPLKIKKEIDKKGRVLYDRNK